MCCSVFLKGFPFHPGGGGFCVDEWARLRGQSFEGSNGESFCYEEL